jgi:putative aminopeptidase FrvX
MTEYLFTEIMQRVTAILDIVSEPAAPFYENRVARAIRHSLAPFKDHPHVQIGCDRYGNVIAQYRHPDAHFGASFAAAAHMDHPGFHVTAAESKTATLLIQGGLPRDERLIGAGVDLYRADMCNHGIVHGYANDDKSSVLLDLDEPWAGPVEGAWGVPDVTRFCTDGDLIHGRGMDDLAGCAQQIAVFELLVREQIPVEYIAIFNRAEEVGFIGAVGACELGSIPSRSIVISLEASKNLEGAQPGKGIIVRTGDRLTIFDASVTALLENAAIAAAQKNVLHQKKRMDGGACEASLYMAYGYETGALAVPLINYHNHGETAVAAEAIHRNDLAGGVVILLELAKLLAAKSRSPRAVFREQCKASFYRRLPEIIKGI